MAGGEQYTVVGTTQGGDSPLAPDEGFLIAPDSQPCFNYERFFYNKGWNNSEYLFFFQTFSKPPHR